MTTPMPTQRSNEDAMLADEGEQTSLLFLQPSPGSTNRPSMSNLLEYGSTMLLPAGAAGTGTADDDEAIQMLDASGRSFGTDDEWMPNSRKGNRNSTRRSARSLHGLFVVATLVVLATLAGVSVQHHKNAHTGSSTGGATAGGTGGAGAKKTQTGQASNSIRQQHGYISASERPLSRQHPVQDLHVRSFQRPEFSSPNAHLFDASTKTKALPTNAWYQNLLLGHGEPTEEQRVYPVPYVVDMVGPIPGMRLHHPTVMGGGTVIQLSQVLEHGLTLGAATPKSFQGGDSKEDISKTYKIVKMTPLGLTLEWTDTNSYNASKEIKDHQVQPQQPLTYSTSIVRGMPYATMQYNSKRQLEGSIQQLALLGSARNQGPHEANNAQIENVALPTLASETPIGAPPLLDGTTKLQCQDMNHDKHRNSNITSGVLVQNEIQLIFAESDYTWVVFVSRPVRVHCIIPPKKEAPAFVPGVPMQSSGAVFALQFLDSSNDKAPEEGQEKENISDDLVVRVALLTDCTYGGNPTTCGRAGSRSSSSRNQTAYAQLLRNHANWYPGPDTDVTFDFVSSSSNQTVNPMATRIKFNWNVQSMNGGEIYDDSIDNIPETEMTNKKKSQPNLLMYALPHHQDMIQASTEMATFQESAGQKKRQEEENQASSFPTHTVVDEYSDGAVEDERFCTSSLLGPVCLVQGSTWSLREEHKWSSFRAPRPPKNDTLSALAKAYEQDIKFKMPKYFARGAGDTYFSGKMLAKFGRILTIGEELSEICADSNANRPDECHGLVIPSLTGDEFQRAFGRLRSNVEVWINGTADTPFVYDDEWGGLVSCGCDFDEKKGGCRNTYPDCPGFSDPGLNFGNAFYNDHHFHYGYHIYAAAVVAHFDPQWGREHFEQVLLLIRDIANPSRDDSYFPTFRQKDWYQGSSWASGIAVSPLNGRNQESSSEAIASYEAIALYGVSMVKAWKGVHHDNSLLATEIQNYGELLSASELRSVDRYWHVIEASKRRQYPVQYTPHVIGIMWNTMAQFQTWFGGAPYLAYGIQLLPLTSVSEERDTNEWVRELYEPFAESCDAHFQDCRDQGWSVLVMAMLATVGHREEAISKALELPSDVFSSAGGNGHSLTNTLWYIATRPDTIDPLVLDPSKAQQHNEMAPIDKVIPSQSEKGDKDTAPPPPKKRDVHFDCGCPDTCNEKSLQRFAFGHTCGDRIMWLMNQKDHTSERDACHQVGVEFPGHCAACDPKQCSAKEEIHSETCPPCSKEICRGKLNLCPIDNAPFLCTDGASIGGCSLSPWSFENGMCTGCCELSRGCED